MHYKKVKHPKAVRDYLAKVKREYRARKKAREAQVVEAEAPLTCKTPTKGVVHNESK